MVIHGNSNIICAIIFNATNIAQDILVNPVNKVIIIFFMRQFEGETDLSFRLFFKIIVVSGNFPGIGRKYKSALICILVSLSF